MTNLIYEPAGRAREYAALACNIYRGCDHGCLYCYAPDATQTARESFVQSKARAGNFVRNLEREIANNPIDGKQVHLCFTCDAYQALDVKLRVTRDVIKLIHSAGATVCILTKGGNRALVDLDLMQPGDVHAATLTLTDNACSAKWEPGAALPQERIDTLRTFHAAGITTWVSLEPVLNPNSAIELIRLTHNFVDIYKVGKLNHHPLEKKIDWKAFGLATISELETFGYTRCYDHDYIAKGQFYVKDDLVKSIGL